MPGWKSRLSLLLLIISLASLSSAIEYDKKPVHLPEYIPGQFVVELYPAQVTPALLASTLQATVIRPIRENLFFVQRSTNESVSEAMQILRANPLVKMAEPNYILHASRTPNDPDYSQLWGLNNTGTLDSYSMRGLQGIDINAEKAWNITTGSKEVVVAVIDTGIDFSIPDLQDNAWTNFLEAHGKTGVDDDGNGYVDDIHGYNFVAGNGDIKDDNGHGSHVSGTIGAHGNDGVGVSGVNWNVSLMAVKFLDSAGDGTLENAIKAIDYARINHARILNNSWGGGPFMMALEKAVEDTRDANEIFVAAAGNFTNDNDAQPTYPASYNISNVISVAAVNNRGSLADFSNFGAKSVHIAAPGVSVFSTVPGGFDTYSGTSMATPHVSGVAALLYADNPALLASEVIERILEYSRPLKSLQGKVATGGIVDAYAALTEQRSTLSDPADPSGWSGAVAYQLSSPHPYANQTTLTFKVTRPGAKRIAVHFARFETEATYDLVSFSNGSGESLGALSGNDDDGYSPIAEGDTIILKLTSDVSNQGYGFDVDAIVFE